MNIDQNYLFHQNYSISSQDNQLQHNQKNQNSISQCSHLERTDSQIQINHVLSDSDEGYLYENNISKQSQQLRNQEINHNNNNYAELCTSSEHLLLLSSSSIKTRIFSKQIVQQSVYLTNTASNGMQISIQSIFPIKIKNKYSQIINGICKFHLEGFERVQMRIKLGKRNDKEQYGDLFETVTIQYSLGSKIQQIKDKIYLPISVYFIMPKLTLSFEGSSEILKLSTISQKEQKIISIHIKENKFSEYPLSITFKSIMNEDKEQSLDQRKLRTQLLLKTYGCINVFPEKLYLQEGQKSKIMLRKKLDDRKSSKGVIVANILNSDVNFIFSVKF